MFSFWNFEEIFELENKRISRPIIKLGNKIGEITFDNAHLKTGHQYSTFYEVEIEANINDSTGAISEIAKFLEQKFPSQLVPSKDSKYERSLKFVSAKANN